MTSLPTITAIDDRAPPQIELPVSGDRVGRFLILGRLGAGGMGAVFLASDPELARQVAIKVVAQGGRDRGLLEEARTLAQLQHPNVVAVHEVGRWRGQVYIAMEHVAGAPLDRWLRDHGDWRERMAVFRQTAVGLAAAHREGIVHRDVKPSNIMVGMDSRVRLIDFGLARATLTSPGGSRDGTPRYMAPEHLRGDSIDARSDQFSFCVALYEALFGGYPFDSVTPDDWGNRGAVAMPPAGELPTAVRDAVVRGLADNPARRHPSMDALIRALDPPRHVERRRPWSLAMAGVLALAGLVAAVAYPRDTPPAPHPVGQWATILAHSGLPPQQRDPLPDDPLQVTVHRLSNGLTVYISPNHDVPRIRAVWRFRSGNADAPGVASLAMAMARRGTEKIGTTNYAAEKPLLDHIAALYARRAAADPASRTAIDRDIDATSTAAAQFEIPDEHVHVGEQLGATVNNLHIYRDETRLEMDIPSNRFKAWAELEADRWTHPVFRMFRSLVAETLTWELAERGMPDAVLDAVLPVLYRGQPYGFRAREEHEAIASEPYAEVERYFRTRFVPNNAELFLSGDIDPVDAIAELEKALAGWAPKELPARVAPRETPLLTSSTVHVTTTRAGRSVSYHWIAPTAVCADPAFDVVEVIFLRMLREHGIDATSFSYLTGYAVFASPTATQGTDDTMRAIDAALDQLRRGEVSDDQLDAARRHLSIDAWFGGWSNEMRVDRMARTHSQMRIPWRDRAHREAAIAHVTRADVMRMAHALFDAPHVTAIAEPGARVPEPVGVPKPPPATFATTSSRAARELVEREVVPIQPRFLVAGTDFEERDTRAGHLVIKRDPKSALFQLVVELDLGYNDGVPVVCAALAARAFGTVHTAWLDVGAQPKVLCAGRVVRITVTALDVDLPRVVDALVATLADPTPAEWAEELAKEGTLDTFRGRSDWIEFALDSLGLFGPGSVPSYDRDKLAATPVGQAARELSLLRRSERWIGYYGPRSLDEVAGLLPARQRGTAPARGRTRFVGGPPRVVLVDASRLTSTAHASVLFGLSDMSLTDARGQMFSEYWDPDVHPLSDELRGVAKWRSDFVSPTTTRSPGWAAFRFEAAPDKVVSAVSRALTEIVDREPDPARFVRAKQEWGERLRADWIAREDVASRVVEFRARGFAGDPRPEQFASFERLAIGDLRAQETEARSAPRVITIWGNLKGIDRARLAELGRVTELSIDQLLDQLAHKQPARSRM